MNFHPLCNKIPEDLESMTMTNRKAVVTRFEASAIKLRYYMTQKQWEQATEVFAPRPLTYAADGFLDTHPHPIPAELNRFAYERCIKTAKKFPYAIDFGGTPLRTPQNVHLCTLIADSRTHARYLNAHLMKYDNDSLLTKQCCKGGENCDYLAPYAFMINVYDIPIENIPLIMERHGVKIMDIWMFLPLNLLNKNYTIDQTFYRNDIIEHYYVSNCCKKIKCRFSFPDDSSNTYHHDYHNWKKYMCTVQIKSDHHMYILEHAEQIGTFTRIRVTQTPIYKIDKDLCRSHNLGGLADCYVVPDVFFYYFNQHAAGNMFHKSYILEKGPVDGILKWSQRQADNAFNYPNFASSMDAKSVSVYYTVEKQQKLVYKGMIVDHPDYERIQLSLFIIGAINRFKRTQSVGSMFNFLKRCDGSTWDLIKHWFREVYYSFTQTVQAKIRLHSRAWWLDESVGLDDTYMANLRIRTIPRYYSNGIIIGRSWRRNPARFVCEHRFQLTDANEYENEIPGEIDWKDDGKDIPEGLFKGEVPKFQPTAPPKPSENVRQKVEEMIKNEESKPTTSRKVANPEIGRTPDKETLKVSEQHCKVIHNPIGDGKCGLHCLRFFYLTLNRLNEEFEEPDEYITNVGQIKDIDSANHCAEELASYAWLNRMNLIIHAEGSHIGDSPGLHSYKYILDDSWPTCKLLFEHPGHVKGLDVVGHYKLVNCNCRNRFIGDYTRVPICEEILYINCANEMLNDGAGQALAFRQLFGAYDRDVIKPVTPVTFIKHKHKDISVHLGLCVAMRANSSTKQQQQQRLKVIFDAIEEHCLEQDIAVYMPLIGTAIFGNDLCCVKREFERLKCRKVLCLFNEDQMINYDQTNICMHGGYTVGATGRPLAINRNTKYDNSDWMLVAPDKDPDKMSHKYYDIEQFAKLHKCTRVVELAAAPGEFLKIKDKQLKYLGFHYKPGWSLRSTEKLGVWSTYADLPLFSKGDFVLLDHCVDKGDPFFEYAHKCLERGAVVTSKFMAYTEEDDHRGIDIELPNIFRQKKLTIWRNDGSDLISSELYYTVSSDVGKANVLDTNKFLQRIDKDSVKRQDAGCVCENDKEFETNAIIKFTPTEQQFNACLKNLLDDKFIQENMRPEEIAYLSKCPYKIDVGNPKKQLTALLGVAGSGKSNSILKNYCGMCALIIAPLKLVSDAHNKQKELNSDSRSVTFIKAFKLLYQKGKRYKYIFVDEVFLVNPYFLTIYQYLAPNASIVGLGDPYQIQADFTGTAPAYIVQQTDKYITTSKRCPLIVGDYIARYIPDFQANKQRKGELKKGDLDNITRYHDDVFLCATQKIKKWLKEVKEQKNVFTIHEAMGSTYETVHVYTNDIDQIKYDRARYVYTALSRATTNIVMYGSNTEVEHFFSILGTPIERTVTNPIVDTVPRADINIDEVVENVQQSEPLRSTPCVPVNVDMVQDILNKVYVKKNDYVENKTLDYKINLLTLPKNQEHLKVPLLAIQPIDVKINGSMVGNTPLVKTYHGKDLLGAVNTTTSRYMAIDKRKPMDKATLKMVYRAHAHGMEKFMKPKHLRSKLIVGKDVVWEGVQEYLVRLQQKFKNNIPDDEKKFLCENELKVYNHIVDDLRFKSIVEEFVDNYVTGRNLDKGRQDYNALIYEKMAGMDNHEFQKFDELNNEWFARCNNKTTYHIKMQPKEIRELYWDTSDKAGQGISAWSKIANVILAAMQRPFHLWLMDNLLPNVMWATDKSDAEIAEEFKARGLSHLVDDNNYTKIPADISQFDQSQLDIITQAVMDQAYFSGVQESVIRFYMDKRTEVFIQSVDTIPNDTVLLHIEFVYKQGMTSGCKMTFTGNTGYTMGLIGAELKFKELGFAMFKGDDSLLAAKYPKFEDYHGKRMSEVTGTTIKWLENPVPEFIANFVCAHGFFPDVLRRVSRTVGRVITHPEQWKEIRLSMADALAVVKSDIEFQRGIECAEIHYRHHGINVTKDEIALMCSFMQRIVYDDELAPTNTKIWEILYVDITRMVNNLISERR